MATHLNNMEDDESRVSLPSPLILVLVAVVVFVAASALVYFTMKSHDDDGRSASEKQRQSRGGRKNDVSLLFAVQCNGSVMLNDSMTELSVDSLSGNVVAFADRPVRWAGTWKIKHFLDQFRPGNSFAVDPPNAVMVGVRRHDSKRVETPITVLSVRWSQTTSGKTKAVFRIKPLSGRPSSRGRKGAFLDDCFLFVDSFFSSVVHVATSVTSSLSSDVSTAVSDTVKVADAIEQLISGGVEPDVMCIAQTGSYCESKLFLGQTNILDMMLSMLKNAPSAWDNVPEAALDAIKRFDTTAGWEDVGVEQATNGLITSSPGPGFVSAVFIRAGYYKSKYPDEYGSWSSALAKALGAQTVEELPPPFNILIDVASEILEGSDDISTSDSKLVLSALGITPAAAPEINSAAISVVCMCQASMSSAARETADLDLSNALTRAEVTEAVVFAIHQVIEKTEEQIAEKLASMTADMLSGFVQKALSDIAGMILVA